MTDRPPHPAGPGSRAAPPPSDRKGYFEGKVITAAEVEARMVSIADSMEDAVYDLAEKATAMAQADVAWQVARSKTRMVERAKPGNGPGGRTTEVHAEDVAITSHEDLLVASVIAEAIYNAAVQALKARTAQLDALRSINATIRGAT